VPALRLDALLGVLTFLERKYANDCRLLKKIKPRICPYPASDFNWLRIVEVY
jgi:hypothetical protein